MFMRALIAAIAATLIGSAVSYAEPTRHDAPSSTSSRQPSSAAPLGIEQRALKASEAQRIRDKKFDDQVNKATASICVGCSPEALPKRSPKIRKAQPAFPLPPSRPPD
jgi:hypothetical protein